MIEWTLEKLKTMAPEGVRTLWENAKRKNTPEALALVNLIESSGIDLKTRKSVSLDDRIGKKMHQIIFSADGKKAARDAVERGLPALAGVDPLLASELGPDYGSHNEATVQAGYLVTNLMRQLGFVDGGQASLPTNCVAKTGRLFHLPPKRTDS